MVKTWIRKRSRKREKELYEEQKKRKEWDTRKKKGERHTTSREEKRIMKKWKKNLRCLCKNECWHGMKNSLMKTPEKVAFDKEIVLIGCTGCSFVYEELPKVFKNSWSIVYKIFLLSKTHD